jgi:hypothetical protein
MQEIMIYKAVMTWEFWGIQAAINPGGYMGTIYPARDVWVVHTTLTVRCRELKIHGSVTTHTSGSVLFIAYAKRMIRLILMDL